MKMDSKPMYSWWAESHNNTPKHSVWLQTALNELDEKTKAMLALIEEEADSFAQRVDMYYKRRPELIGLIEQFYRAYRSLASRYDLLKAKIKLQELTPANSQQQPQQKSQSDSQVKEQQQEEPESQQTPATLHSPILITSEALMETPFGKPVVAEDDSMSRGFQRLVRRYDTCDSESESTSEVEDAEREAKNNAGVSEQDSEVTSICSSSFSDGDSESSEGKIKFMETVISNLEKNNVKLVRQLNMKNHQLKLLREEVGKLKKEKSFWKEECSSQARKKTLLEKQIQMFRTEYSKIWNSNDLKVQETQALQEKIDFLQKENNNLTKTNVVLSAVLKHINEQKDSFDRKLKEDTARLYEEKINVEKMLEAEKQSVSEHIQKLEHFEYSKIWNSNDLKVQETQTLQEKIDFLQKENNNLTKTNVVLSAVLKHINEQKDSFDRKLKEDTTRLYEEKINAEKMLEAEKQSVSEHIQKLEHFEKEIYRLCEENKERGEELLQRNEEKIEAIRQLSVAMESLRVENKMLEAILRTVRSASKKKTTNNKENRNPLWRIFSMPA